MKKLSCDNERDCTIQPYMVDMIRLMADSKRRARQILFRVTDEERKIMKEAADAEDRTVSDWIRLTVRSRLQEMGLAPEKKAKKK